MGTPPLQKRVRIPLRRAARVFVAKIVDHHHLMAIAQQSTDRVRSNVTAAGKANIHERKPWDGRQRMLPKSGRDARLTRQFPKWPPASPSGTERDEYRLLRLSAGKLAHVVKLYTSGVT